MGLDDAGRRTRPGAPRQAGEVRNHDTQQAVTFHDMTRYYPLSDTEPGDERIGIGDPTARTEAIWQKDWDIKPFLYKVYETVPPIELTRDRRTSAGRRLRPSLRPERKQWRRTSFPDGRCSGGLAC